MVPTVLSSDEYRTSLSQVVQRDYFPSLTDVATEEPYLKSVTDFHRNVTSADAFALELMQQEKSKEIEHKNSVIYGRKRKLPNSDHHFRILDATVTPAKSPSVAPAAELRNALYFPISMTDSALSQAPSVSETNPRDFVQDAAISFSSSEHMLPPPSRPSALRIDPAATRFPSSNVAAAKHPKNIYQSDAFHWEGSTKADDDDQSSIFTDLDATTVDSYSVQSELQKAARSSLMVPALIPAESTADVDSKITYQIPVEPSRDIIAEGILRKQRQRQQTSLRRREISHERRDHVARSSSKIPPSPRSSGSLRFALRATYKKPSANAFKSVLEHRPRKKAP